MPVIEKIAKLDPDLEFFCLEVSGKHINTLIDRYNQYLNAYNARRSATNHIDRYTHKEEKEALEYLTDVYKRLNGMITKNKNPSQKNPDENIQESKNNYKTYMLLMSMPHDKIALFKSSTANKNTVEPTGGVKNLITQYEQRAAAPHTLKSSANTAKNNPNKVQKEIEKAEETIAAELIKVQIEKDAELAAKLQSKQSLLGAGAQKLFKAINTGGAAKGISSAVLNHESRIKIVEMVYRSKGKMLEVEAIIEALPLKQPKRTDNIIARKKVEIFHKFTNEKPDNLFDFFKENKVTERKLSQDPIAGKDYFSIVLTELVKHKSQLGGSPVFGQNKPFIEDKDSGQFMFGVPIAAVKDWMRMTIAQEWVPKNFWKNLGKKFGVSDREMSKYEEAHLCIQRFGLLIANKERFLEMLNNNDTQRYIELSQITGLAWHPIKNAPSVEKEYIEFIEQFLTIYFERAKKEGSEAMEEYFQAFKGVCLEDRTRNLLEYAMKHPLEENTTPMPADWDTSSPAENAFEKEVQVLGIQIQELPTPEQLYKFLQQKGIFDLEFTTKDGTKAKPTKENYDIWAQEMVDLCVLNDPNDLPGLHV